MELDQHSTHKQIGAKVEQLGLESDSDSNAFGEFALKSTVAGLGMLAQARMEVGRVDDPAEVEADAMALDFLRWQQSSGQLSAPAHEQISSGQTSRSSSNGTMETGGFAVGDSIESDISRETGRGSGLDGSTRGQFEGFFGVDLGGVRLHADSKAAELSRSLGAEAFTVGNDVFFGEGRFTPGSSSGMGLLAHELTHVVQQGGSSMRRVDPNAVALSRSPLSGAQMIRRVDFSDSSALEGHDLIEKVSGSGANAASLREFQEVKSGFKMDVNDPDGIKSAEGLALISSSLNTASAVADLFEAFQTSTQATVKDRVAASFGAVKAATDMSKSVCESVQAASALSEKLALSLLPGLGLAVSLMSLADNVYNTLLPLMTARNQTSKVLQQITEKKSGITDTELLKKADLDIAAVSTLLSTEHRQIGFAIADIVADVTQVVGQIATLATGPFGMAVTLLGVAMNLGTQVVRKVTEWALSNSAYKKKLEAASAKGHHERAIAAATLATDAAAAAPSDKALADKKTAADATVKAKKISADAAEEALIKSDANSAFIRILEMSFAPIRLSPTEVMDVEQRKLLIDLKVSENFINATVDELRKDSSAEIRHDDAVGEASELVAVGEPILFTERVKNWGKAVVGSFTKVGNWLAKKAGGEKPIPNASDEVVKKEATASTTVIANYVRKKSKQGHSGVKVEQVNNLLQAPYIKLVTRLLVDPAKEAQDLEKIGEAIKLALQSILAGASSRTSQIEIDTIEVTAERGKVTVTFKTKEIVAAEQAAAAQAAAAAAAQAAAPGAGRPTRALPPAPGAAPAGKAAGKPAPAKTFDTVNPAYGHRTRHVKGK